MCFHYLFVSIAVAVLAITFGVTITYFEFQEDPDQIRYLKMSDTASQNFERFKTENHSAFVLGYTGEVGKALVKDLSNLKLFKRVVLIGRREVPLELGSEFEQKVIDFDKLDEHEDAFADLDIGFCCMGTTRSKAGSKGFVKVDHDYIVNSAEKAKAKSCRHFSLVSTAMANKDSMFLYTKTKGETEEDLKAIGFDRLSIYRPAMLMCDRQESRPLEFFSRLFMKPLASLFPTSGSVPVEVVARAMINDVVTPADESSSKSETFENKAIHLMSTISKACKKPNAAATPKSDDTKEAKAASPADSEK